MKPIKWSIRFALAAGLALAADSGYNLFQKGLAKERADADPRGAIKIYEQVVRENAKDRKLAAQALVRIAECYAKLGDLQSRQVYERIVREFGDQAEAVATARARLGSASKSQAVATRRLIERKGDWAMGRPSRDGRIAAGSDFNGGMLYCDLASGEIRPFAAVPKTELVYQTVVSPDGKWIAYGGQPDRGIEALRLVAVDGGSAPRTVIATQGNSNVAWFVPLAFAPDQKEILVTFNRPGQTAYHLGFVSIADGTMRVIREFPFGSSRQADVSPDGKWVAFDMHASDQAHERDIHVIRTDGSGEHKLIDHAASDFDPIWTPDGRGLVFRSNRRGPSDVWFQAVKEGQAVGQPVLVRADVEMPLYGVTTTGSVLYAIRNITNDIFLQDFDSATGAPKSEPRKVAIPYQGEKSLARLSPDGQSLIYVRPTPGKPGLNTVVLRQLATGIEREFYPNVGQLNRIRWFEDGRSLSMVGRTVKETWAQYRLDLTTGQTTLQFEHFPIDGANLNFTPGAPSPDGKTLYLQTWGGEKHGGLYAYDLATRQTRTVLSPRGWELTPPVVSPDGAQLATVAIDQKSRSRMLVVVNVSDGAVRDLGSVGRGSYPVGWTRDGKTLIIRTLKENDANTVQLWRYPANGTGVPLKVDAGKVGDFTNPMFVFHAPPFDPDHIAWTGGGRNWTSLEVWSADHALPKP